MTHILTRGGAVAARRTHYPQAVGSIPTPATNPWPALRSAIVVVALCFSIMAMLTALAGRARDTGFEQVSARAATCGNGGRALERESRGGAAAQARGGR